MSDLRTPEVEDLLTVLAGIEKNDDAYALLEDLFTVREIKDISQRLSVARLLKEGKSYTSIEQLTGASATTIARVSKALNLVREVTELPLNFCMFRRTLDKRNFA